MSRRTWLLPLFATLAAFAVGLIWPSAPAQPRAADEDRWHPVDVAALARFDEMTYQTARGIRWAGEVGVDSNGPGSAATWQLVGIVRDPQPAALIHMTGADKIQRLGKGDIVPGGGLLTEIGSDRVVIEHEGCHWNRWLYSRDRTSDPGLEPTCEQQAAPTPMRETNDEA